MEFHNFTIQLKYECLVLFSLMNLYCSFLDDAERVLDNTKNMYSYNISKLSGGSLRHFIKNERS